ncbi:MAG: PHP domain-containing protein [Gemmatimonadetes bacterium]|nr:PHP domain-containing protein [Gemmatimonadota bacterium]
MVQVDLHTHTNHSLDGHASPAELVERARLARLDRIAVTDHGTIEGAFRARELDPELVIVGEEIRCACRTELIGLFLSEEIPMRLPLEEVVDRIREQGGLIYAPHPFAYALEPRRRAERALGVADVVEAINARAFLPWWNRAARRAAEARGIPCAAGSDAHFAHEVGRARTLMPAFGSVDEFASAIQEARPIQDVVSGPAYHVASLGINWSRRAGRALSALSATAPRDTQVARAS